jgi:hypothetical protein
MRRGATDARRAHDWKGVLRYTARAACWQASQERGPLRVKALMELGRFEDCTRAAEHVSSASAEVRGWAKLCRKRQETAT